METNPEVDWRAPEGILDQDYWKDAVWRDEDAATTMQLRRQVLARLGESLERQPPSRPRESSDLGAVLALSVLSVGLAAGQRRKRKKR